MLYRPYRPDMPLLLYYTVSHAEALTGPHYRSPAGWTHLRLPATVIVARPMPEEGPELWAFRAAWTTAN